MLSQVHSPSAKSDRTVAPTKILEFRSQYKSCRIRVPDLELPVAAILVDREYYSFFKAVQEPSKVLAIVAKLGIDTLRAKATEILKKLPKGNS